MRAFLAFDLEPAFIAAASEIAARLRPAAPPRKLRWCAPETMHVTARFFGTVSDPTPLAALVPRLARPAPLVRAAKVDAFPQLRRARVLVLALEDDGTLKAVADEAERAAVALGFAPETRSFRPHLTLARLKEPADVRDLVIPVGFEGRATALTLYESKTGAAGPVYTAISRSFLDPRP